MRERELCIMSISLLHSKLTDEEGFEEITIAELLPNIIVKDPVTHDTWEQGKFTTYQICVQTDHPAFHLSLSAVRRRYSEIRWLYNTLKGNHAYLNFPAPPPKKVFAERFDIQFINTRMKEIESFLNDLVIIDTVLSDAAFHLFLQTDLTTHEIDEYFSGSLPEDIIESAWKNAGHIHTSSYVVNTSTIPYKPQEIVMNEEDRQNYRHTSISSDDSFSQSVTESDIRESTRDKTSVADSYLQNTTTDITNANNVVIDSEVQTLTDSTDSIASDDCIVEVHFSEKVIEMKCPSKFT